MTWRDGTSSKVFFTVRDEELIRKTGGRKAQCHLIKLQPPPLRVKFPRSGP